jgi:glycerate dehydrogenase
MKIVVIDSATCGHGGLSWNAINSLGEVILHPRTGEDEILSRMQGAQCVLTNKVPFSRKTIESLPLLKYIGVTATGYNIIDLEAAREAGIAVTNVPAYSTTSVTQHAFALVLSVYSRVHSYDHLGRSGAWSRSPDFCVLNEKIEELAGQTIGIIGYGNIGKRIATVAEAFGMSVLIYSRSELELPNQVSLEHLLERSDIVTLHCPLFPETQRMVNAEFLRAMKRSAILVNTARGGLVDEDALYTALSQGIIRHACLDVLEKEPPLITNRLLTLKNITVTPHVAWASDVARQRLIDESVENLRVFMQGSERNRIV